jgi:hypothetical protein
VGNGEMLPFNLFRVFTFTAGLLSSVTLSAWAADDAATSAQHHPVDVPNPAIPGRSGNP